MWGRTRPAVPEPLVTQVEEALQRAEEARLRMVAAVRSDAGMLVRRQAHADLRAAHLDADRLLRHATELAKAHSHREWSHWRHRLSDLSTARMQHLFLESDDSGVLPSNSIRAVDTGMSGPAIGEFQHGDCSMPGKPATYGLDLEQTLLDLERDVAMSGPDEGQHRPTGHPTRVRRVERVEDQRGRDRRGHDLEVLGEVEGADVLQHDVA